MTPAKAFRYFHGMKLHFNNENFDILKYSFDAKLLMSKFEKLTTSQKYQFDWLGRKFPTTEDMVFASIGCIFEGIDMQFGNKDDIQKAYYKYKSRREGLAYAIRSDNEKREYDDTALSFEGLIYKFLAKEYCPEFVILNDDWQLTQLKQLYNDRNFGFCRDKILHLIKYSKFFNAEKYSHLVTQNDHHNHATV